MTTARLQDGSVIVEVALHPEDDDTPVLLTVSKARYEEDNVTVRISRRTARALGELLLS